MQAVKLFDTTIKQQKSIIYKRLERNYVFGSICSILTHSIWRSKFAAVIFRFRSLNGSFFVSFLSILSISSCLSLAHIFCLPFCFCLSFSPSHFLSLYLTFCFCLASSLYVCQHIFIYVHEELKCIR